jgi:hypothetical protein
MMTIAFLKDEVRERKEERLFSKKPKDERPKIIYKANFDEFLAGINKVVEALNQYKEQGNFEFQDETLYA